MIDAPFHLTSTLAAYLAAYDRELARVLIEPCFEDWSWLFGGRDWSYVYSSIPPLSAAASIDPHLAAATLRELIETHLQDRPSRQLASVWGVLSRWQEMTADARR